MVREARDLRQVGHHQHLATRGETRQATTDGESGLPADPGVDLIETSVPTSSRSASTLRQASSTRESSPPDAALASGRAG